MAAHPLGSKMSVAPLFLQAYKANRWQAAAAVCRLFYWIALAAYLPILHPAPCTFAQDASNKRSYTWGVCTNCSQKHNLFCLFLRTHILPRRVFVFLLSDLVRLYNSAEETAACWLQMMMWASSCAAVQRGLSPHPKDARTVCVRLKGVGIENFLCSLGVSMSGVRCRTAYFHLCKRAERESEKVTHTEQVSSFVCCFE